MVAYADWVGSDWLVAVIVTVCAVAMLAGAVYRPVALNVPTPSGAINHAIRFTMQHTKNDANNGYFVEA